MSRHSITHEVNIGADFSDEEREFMLAMQREKERTGQVVLGWRQVLAVARRLGYEKTEPGTGIPGVVTAIPR